MDLQKINWKIFPADPKPAVPEIFFKVFNTWIPESPEVFVDVADYQHAHDGPVTVLVGHQADFWLDDSGRRRGLLYNRRTSMDGTNGEKLSDSLRALLGACVRLESDPAFGGKLKFAANELLFIVNDRAIAPNTKETFSEVKPDLEKLASKIYGPADFVLEHLIDPRRRFSVKITSRRSSDVKSLMKKLEN